MENKITMSGLAAMIALASGQPGQLCETFLKELFIIIADELANGENVRIKGLGTFKVVDVEARKSVDVTTGEEIEIPAHRKVIFVASKELAAFVNAPFEAFEAVEVSDALPTDELLDVAEIAAPENLTDENDGLDIEEMADSEESQSISELDHSLNDADSGKDMASENISVKESEETSEEVHEVAEELNLAETVGPVIINSDITSIGIEEQGNNTSVPSSDIAVSNNPNDVDEMEEKEEDSAPVISFSSPITAHASRKEEMNDTDSGELEDEKRPVNKESITTIHFESAESDENEEAHGSRSRFGSGFLTGFLSAIAIIALVMLIGVRFDMVPDKVSRLLTKSSHVGEKVEATDKSSDVALSGSTVGNHPADTPQSTSPLDENEMSGDAVPTIASDEPIYDVVSTTRYLTTMAKEHYGNFNLWPIIYEENQSFLGHPDRIKPGTQVVIPPLSKYKVDPDNPEDINRIKQKGVSIYAKYK